MKEQFMDWKPSPESLARLRTVNGILKEYAADRITLTLRQLYYQLVGKAVIANSLREYQKLGNLLSKARLAGLVDWDAIEDRARQAVAWRCYDSIQQCVEEAAEAFALPRWRTQPEYVELWCEKDALSSVLKPICSELFVTLSVGVQGDDVVLWWEHDDQPDEGLRERWNVSLVWTGHNFIPYGDFVGTVTTPEGLVWHVYAGKL